MKQVFVAILMTILLILLAIGGPAKAEPHTWPVIANQDFYNRTYNCRNAKVMLKNGQYREHGNVCNEFWWLTYLDYADVDRDGEPEAIVSLRSIPCGSKLWTDDVFIFKIIKGQLHQIGQIWQEDLESISVVDGSLVIVAPFWSDTDAHCCPSLKEKAVYVFKAGKLEKVSSNFTKIERK